MAWSKPLALLMSAGVAACATAADDPSDAGADPDADLRVPDAGGPDGTPIGTPCDPILQDCGTDQKCALIVTDVGAQTGFTGCVPNGDKIPGQACTRPTMPDTADDCISGAHCVFDTCHVICQLGTPGTPCTTGTCIGVNNLDMQFDICLPACDVLAPTCAPDEGCYLISMGEGVCAPPVSGSGVPPHGPCSAPNDCAPGSGCLSYGDPPVSECLVYCDHASYPNVRDPAHCAVGEICITITGEPVVGACL
jgi:hypothetical protein